MSIRPVRTYGRRRLAWVESLNVVFLPVAWIKLIRFSREFCKPLTTEFVGFSPCENGQLLTQRVVVGWYNV